jgi:cyclic-di-GMP-binding protein
MKAKKEVTMRAGIDIDTAKKIVKLIKEKKLKVQAAIQGEQVRVTGKKRDDLQGVMAFLREADVGLPIQFNNFRD